MRDSPGGGKFTTPSRPVPIGRPVRSGEVPAERFFPTHPRHTQRKTRTSPDRTAAHQGFDNDARMGLLPRIYLWQLTQLKVICVYAKVAASMFLDFAASTKASA